MRKPLVPLFADRIGTTLAYSKWGDGGVIVLSDGWLLSNQGVNKGDNLTLALNAVEHERGIRATRVTFDEYHHGYSRDNGILGLLDLPAKLGLVTIGVAFLLLVFSNSRRFGTPIPLREGIRQRGEYLGSMAALLRKAKATDLVRQELGQRFLADIATALGVAPGSSTNVIMEAAQRRCPDKLSAIQELCSAAVSREPISEAAIFAVARRWHKMREDLTK